MHTGFRLSLALLFAVLPWVLSAQSCQGFCGGITPVCGCDRACFDFGDCCADVAPVCLAPRITAVVAPGLPTRGGVAVELLGSNFGLPNQTPPYFAARLRVGSRDVDIESWQDTRIVFQLPAGQGSSGVELRNQWNAQLEAPYPLRYDPPALSSLSPASGPTSGGRQLDLAGANFGVEARVTVGGVECAVDAAGQTHERLSCTLPPGRAGDAPVRVEVGDQLSNALPFRYLLATPVGALPWLLLPVLGMVLAVTSRRTRRL